MRYPAATASSRRSAAASLLSLALALTACGGTAQSEARAPLAGAKIGGPFTLIDKRGATVRWGDFAGKYRVVYFGYTFCPDACPTDLAIEARGLDRFGKAHPALADSISPIFITIDPARDTPKIVGEFAAAFSPHLIGLTGSAAQVAQAAKAFGTYYGRGKDVPGGYIMEHSRIAFLMGRDGAPLAMLPLDQGAAAVAAELARWVK